jgi:hypothetical protein
MKNHIPTFTQWLNEADVPYDIEAYRLDKMKWTFNQELKDKFQNDNDDVENAKVYVAEDKDRNLVYTFMTWTSESELFIHLNENKKTVFEQAYFAEDRRYYDQDCEIIIGFKIKN